MTKEMLCYFENMTDKEIDQSWVREQEWNRAHGLPYYKVLINTHTWKVDAKIGRRKKAA